MGEYYDWVNVDKREYICPHDFDHGNKLHESMWFEDAILKALRTLLNDEWKGCHILFLGDEGKNPGKSSNGVLNILQQQTEMYDPKGHYFEMMLDTYRNVSCLFRESEPMVREKISRYIEICWQYPDEDELNEYRINIDDPFNGLFVKTARDFHYTINDTKKVYYSHKKIKVYDSRGKVYPGVDPLPMLMAYGRVTEPGVWLGDIIRVSDEPEKEYTLLEEIHIQNL